MITLTTLSWRMKQIFIFVAMLILRTVGTGQPRTLAHSCQTPLLSEKVIIWCGVASFGAIGAYFFEDQAGSNSKFSPLHWDAWHISGTGVAESWCWNPGSVVSARRGNDSHCEDCNASSKPDVSSSRDLTKRKYRMVCKTARSQRLRLLALGIYEGRSRSKVS